MRRFSPPFPLGHIVVTPPAEECLSSEEITWALRRHARGDWGEIRADEVQANNLALIEGRCVASFFRDQCQRRFCVLTDGPRTMTLVMSYPDRG